MTDNEISSTSPDPSWDYYTIWHSLLHHKAQIDAALKIIKDIEDADDEIDKKMHDLLDQASDNLIDILGDLEPEQD